MSTAEAINSMKRATFHSQLKTFAAILWASMLLPGNTWAQGPYWTKVFGSAGSVVRAIETEGSAVYALTDSALWESTDQGATWDALCEGWPSYDNFLVDSLGFMYRIVTGNQMPVTERGVERSTDHGVSWSVIVSNASGPAANILSMLQKGIKGDLLYKMSYNNGMLKYSTFFEDVYRSTDQGATWIQVLESLSAINGDASLVRQCIEMPDGDFFSAMGYETASDHMGGIVTTNPRRVLRSTNKGASWSWCPQLTWANIQYVAMADPLPHAGPTLLFAAAASTGGYFTSTDGGISWNLTYWPVSNPVVSFVSASPAGVIFVGANKGVFRTHSLGTSTSDIYDVSTGLESPAVQRIRFDGNNIAYVLSGGMLYRTTQPQIPDTVLSVPVPPFNHSAPTWLSMGLAGQDVLSLDETPESVFIAGTATGQIFRSLDSSQSWVPSKVSWSAAGGVTNIVAAAGLKVFGTWLSGPGVTPSEVVQSTDGGATWTIPENTLACCGLAYGARQLAVTSRWKDTVVGVGRDTYGMDGIIYSVDGGDTWRIIQDTANDPARVTNYCVGSGPFGQVMVNIASKTTAWTDTQERLWIFTPSTGTVSPPLQQPGGVYVSARKFAWLPNDLWYAATDAGIFRLDHDGIWHSSNMGLPSGDLQSLVALPGGLMFAGGNGIFASPDSGNHWFTYDNGLPSGLTVNCLLVNGHGVLLAGTSDGIFTSTNRVTPAADGPSTRAVPTRFDLFQNYPNPFNPTTVISGQWTADSKVTLVVFDLLGRKVATLADGRYPAGKYSFTFDGTSVASGVYFCRLTAGSYTAVRKMLLIR